MGYIPQERAQDAIKAGFKLGEQNQSQGPENHGFTLGNIASNVGTGLKNLGKGMIQGASDIGGAILPQAMGGDPFSNLQLVHHIVDPMQGEAAKARQALSDYHAASAMTPGPVRDAKMKEAASLFGGHVLASTLPVVGPMAAQLGEQAGQGDVGGAMAQGATMMLAPKVGELALKGAGMLSQKTGTPEALYEGSLKPSTTISQGSRDQMIQTALKNGIPVSASGLEKLGDLIDDLNQKVKATIQSDPSRPINTVPALNNLNSVRAKFSNQVTPQSDMAAIDQTQTDFLNNPKVQPVGQGPGPGSLSASDAQAMKQGTYQAIGSKAYDQRMGASVEAQKALARGLKEEIATQFPELQNLNASESKLLDLQPVLERAVNRIGNHQIIGLGTPAVAGGTALVTGSPMLGGIVGTLKAIVDNPLVKSKLAIALSKAADIPIGKANARVSAYSAGLGSYGASNADNSSGQANAPSSPQ
jgi:hypothetical protein